MSYTDVGKDAKRKGAMHPKHAQVPPDKPTPKAVKRAKVDKPYGFSYETRCFKSKWRSVRRWWAKEAHRDQAFEKERVSQASWGPNGFIGYRNLTKVER